MDHGTERYGDLTSHACEYLVLDGRRQEQARQWPLMIRTAAEHEPEQVNKDSLSYLVVLEHSYLTASGLKSRVRAHVHLSQNHNEGAGRMCVRC